jgi:DNA-binding transcriptional LysR family regulator
VTRGRDTWRILGPGAIEARLRINNGEALRQAALAGGGVILQPEMLLDDDVRAGRLHRLLPRWEPRSRPIHVVYLPDRLRAAKVRAFVEFVVERFAT